MIEQGAVKFEVLFESGENYRIMKRIEKLQQTVNFFLQTFLLNGDHFTLNDVRERENIVSIVILDKLLYKRKIVWLANITRFVVDKAAVPSSNVMGKIDI